MKKAFLLILLCGLSVILFGQESQSQTQIGSIILAPGQGIRNPASTTIHIRNGININDLEKEIPIKILQYVKKTLQEIYTEKDIFLTSDYNDIYLRNLSINQIMEILEISQRAILVSIFSGFGGTEWKGSGY